MARISQQFKKQFQFYNAETAFSLRIHQVFLKSGNYFKNSRNFIVVFCLRFLFSFLQYLFKFIPYLKGYPSIKQALLIAISMWGLL